MPHVFVRNHELEISRKQRWCWKKERVSKGKAYCSGLVTEHGVLLVLAITACCALGDEWCTWSAMLVLALGASFPISISGSNR